MIPPVSLSSRRDALVCERYPSLCPIPLRASWNTRGFFSDRTLSPVARAAKSLESDALLRIPPSVGASLGALSPKLSTQIHRRLVTGDPGTVRPNESREAYTESATPS